MIWLDVKGYENEYQLSEKGELRRKDIDGENHIVKSCKASNGKLYVTLWRNGVRKNFMLHNLYSDTFSVSVKTAMQIIYEGYEGNFVAISRVKMWLQEKIHECEQQPAGMDGMHDEILYLKSFLKHLSNQFT